MSVPKSVRPEVRGTTDFFMAEPIPYPKRPPRTPSRRSSFFAADGRAETDSSYFELRGHYCAPFQRSLKSRECYYVGLVRPALSSQDELLLAR